MKNIKVDMQHKPVGKFSPVQRPWGGVFGIRERLRNLSARIGIRVEVREKKSANAEQAATAQKAAIIHRAAQAERATYVQRIENFNTLYQRLPGTIFYGKVRLKAEVEEAIAAAGLSTHRVAELNRAFGLHLAEFKDTGNNEMARQRREMEIGLMNRNDEMREFAEAMEKIYAKLREKGLSHEEICGFSEMNRLKT